MSLACICIMSRIWKLPIQLLEWVTFSYEEATRAITVTGPKWTLNWVLPQGVGIEQQENEVVLSLITNDAKALWGLSRALVANMVIGVHTWYEKKLQVIWVGYNAKVQWNKILLNLGYSHSIDHVLAQWVTASVEKDPKWNDMVVLQSIDKQLVWEQAAKIRSYRKPEPYKWKGVRYLWEYIKMKAGKTAAKK